MKYRKKPTSMFAEFHTSDEYQDAYKRVMDNTKKGNQFELVIFFERLRATLTQESICNVCHMEYPHLEENKTEVTLNIKGKDSK